MARGDEVETGISEYAQDAQAQLPSDREPQAAQGVSHREAGEEVRQEANKRLSKGEDPIPEWSPASIFDHWLNHNTDPEIQTWIQLWRLQNIMTQLYEKGLFVLTDGRLSLDIKETKALCDLTTAWQKAASRDCKKLAFYSHGAHIDTGSRPIINTRTKNIYNLFPQLDKTAKGKKFTG